MKRPIINSYERFTVIHFPDSFSAAWINKNIAVLRFRRELDRTIIKIIQTLSDSLELAFGDEKQQL